MHRTRALKQVIALLGATILALPLAVIPASAEQAPSRLDDEVSQRLQTTPDSQLIPVIVEGAAAASPQTPSTRAQRAEDHVRGSGGHVVATSNLLGATVAPPCRDAPQHTTGPIRQNAGA